VAKQMGDFYKSQYAAPYTAGIPAAGQGDTQAQQQKIAADMGKLYRSQFAPAGVEAQVEAQQKAQQKTASKVDQPSIDATPETLLAVGPSPAEEGTTAAPVPQSATDCKTKDELDAWFKAQSDNLKKFVPKAYQQYPLGSLKTEYDTNLKRIEAPPTEAPIAPDAPLKDSDIFDTKPLALESKDGASLRKAVDEAQKKAQGKVDSAVDKATNKFGDLADRFKHGFDSAAHKVRSKTDSVFDEAQQKLQAEAQKQQSPEVLAAKAPSVVASRPVAALMLVVGSGAFVGLWLQQQRNRRPAEELMSDDFGFEYHIQA